MRRYLTIGICLLMILVLLPMNNAFASENGFVNVKLIRYVGNQTSITFTVHQTYFVENNGKQLSAGTYKIVKSGSLLNLYSGSTLIASDSHIKLVPTIYNYSTYLSIYDASGNPNDYLGIFDFTIDGSYIRPIESLPMKDYLKGVVPSEVYSSWDIEALKSQAIAARTYALYHDGTTMTDTTASQAYNGYNWQYSSLANTNKAVDDTDGQVIKYNGAIIDSFFTASNGGYTLSNTNAWGSLLVPYLAFQSDPYDLKSGSPNNVWSFQLAKTQIDMTGKSLTNPDGWWGTAKEANSSSVTRVVNDITSTQSSNFIALLKSYMIEKSQVLVSGDDIKIYRIDGLSFNMPTTSNETIYGTITVSYYVKENGQYVMENGSLKPWQSTYKIQAYSFRGMMNSGNSTSYGVMLGPLVVGTNYDSTSGNYIVNGRGWGHGIGMSQWGAAERAAEGQTYDQILGFYYPGTSIVTDPQYIDNKKIYESTYYFDKPQPQIAGTPITLTAFAVGHDQMNYEFNVQYNDGAWNVLQDYSTDNTLNWVPDKPGTYKFSIHYRNNGSTAAYDGYDAFEYQVAPKAVSLDQLTPSIPSPQNINTPIGINVSASGGTQILYQYWVEYNNNWTMLKDYSTASSLQWTPTVPGDYRISVHVKDVNSANEYDDYGYFDYKIVQPILPVQISSVSFDKPEPQAVGNTIQISTGATGGSNLLYQYWIEDNTGTWKVLRDYTSSNTVNWTPNEKGDYRFSVHVKSANSTKDYEAYKGFSYQIYEQAVKVTSVTADKSSPQINGSTINITANATGGSTRLYQFWAGRNGTWTLLRDYSTSNVYSWTPTISGDYVISVHVKDKESTKDYDAYGTLGYKIATAPLKYEGVTFDKQSPQATNAAINITAKTSGGSDVLYQFWFEDHGVWKLLRDYSRSNQYQWIPKTAGDYKFSIHIKNSTSKNAYDTYGAFYYKIVPGVDFKALTIDKASPQPAGTTVTFAAETIGGIQPVYQFWIEQNGVWSILQDYSTSNILKWTPKTAGTYRFSVHVKDVNSINDYDDYYGFNYSIN